jgi:hypothetical protein
VSIEYDKYRNGAAIAHRPPKFNAKPRMKNNAPLAIAALMWASLMWG